MKMRYLLPTYWLRRDRVLSRRRAALVTRNLTKYFDYLLSDVLSWRK
jgi:hypothetical protein